MPSSRPSMPSHSCHSQKSSSSFGSLSCITVKRDDPENDQAGIRLVQDRSTGKVTVANITDHGMFSDTELAVGDIVLAMNKQRLREGEGTGKFLKILLEADTISIAVKKPSPAGSSLKRSRKKNKLSSSSSSSTHHHHHHSKSGRRKSLQNNNSFKINDYYEGMTKHNKDGSIRLTRSIDTEETAPTKALTISASKPPPVMSGSNPAGAKRGVGRNKSCASALQGSTRKHTWAGKGARNLDSVTTHNTNNETSVGIDLEVVDGRLVVQAISDTSIFGSTKLRLCDVILSINDMSFRKFADAEYATTIMEKARLMVTLVVERPIDDCDDTSDESSLSSFGNDDMDYDADASAPLSQSFAHSASGNFRYGSSDGGGAIEGGFHAEWYKPVTISVPKSRKSQDHGLVFRIIRSQSEELEKQVSYLLPKGSAPPKHSKFSQKNKRNLWVYIDKIEKDSIFRNTSLRRGDKVLCINNTNLKEHPDPRTANQACDDSKEAIAMVVLKENYHP